MGAVDYSPVEVGRELGNGKAATSQRGWQFPANVRQYRPHLMLTNEKHTSQFPPPTARCPSTAWLPKVNILSSPFWMTTNTSIQALLFARFPADSLYCLRHNIPSFAHGGPSSASSSSVMLIVVSAESSLPSLRSSSSCVSRMIVYDRLEAKPKAGVKKDNAEP